MDSEGYKVKNRREDSKFNRCGEPFSAYHCYENRLSSVHPEPVEGSFMVRQACPEHSRRAHHERHIAQLIFILCGVSVQRHDNSEGAKRPKNLAQDRLHEAILL